MTLQILFLFQSAKKSKFFTRSNFILWSETSPNPQTRIYLDARDMTPDADAYMNRNSPDVLLIEMRVSCLNWVVRRLAGKMNSMSWNWNEKKRERRKKIIDLNYKVHWFFTSLIAPILHNLFTQSSNFPIFHSYVGSTNPEMPRCPWPLLFCSFFSFFFCFHVLFFQLSLWIPRK